MNLAQSDRLRLRYLLLLAPLLMASTPAPLPLARELALGQVPIPIPTITGELVFLNPPSEIVMGTCVPITLQLHSPLGLPIGALVPITIRLSSNTTEGAFYGSPACDVLNDVVVIPTGESEATAWYRIKTGTSVRGVTITASAGVLDLLDPSPLFLSVVAYATSSFSFSAPTQVPEGTPFEVMVTAYDNRGTKADGYAGTVHLRSEPPIPWLHPDATFIPSVDQGQKKFTLVLPAGGPYTLTVQDVSNANLQGLSEPIYVMGGQPTPRVAVTPATVTAATCKPTQVYLGVVDGSGRPMQGTVYVSFCRAKPGPAVIVDSTFGQVSQDKACVTGTLTNTGRVDVSDTLQGDDVPFMLYSTPSNAPVSLTFRAEPNPAQSSISFVDSDETIPRLAPSSPPLTLQLNLTDFCGRPLAVPVDKVTFKADPPLSLGTATSSPGQWSIPVQLGQCPADLTRPLAIQPLLGDQPLFGGEFDRFVEPRCGVSAELSVHSSMGDQPVKPGEQVLFEVELSNTGQEAILNGVLVLSAQGMTAVEASLDGVPLTQQQGGFVLPELQPGAQVKVKVKAVATTQLDEPVTAKVKYTSSDGTPLTEEEPISFTRDDLGVNVGCGCHATELPNQLLPWLALLLAASRPWERLRRLRRGERIDRQAPW